MTKRLPLLAYVLVSAGANCLNADEGLWLFNNFPREAVQKKYGFSVTDAFLDKLRLGAVRFNSGGSGSWVSPDGLLFTNHHVGADCIAKVSDAEHDYLKNGFSAKTAAEEKACPDLEINILEKIEDVTARVNAGISATTALAEAGKLRRANMANIEKACNAETGLRCNVVTLYSGGVYNMYRYKKYTDIRLVFAPEKSIGFFGGDDDNFEYPRYCLDVAFFRAYEAGKPLKSANYLKFSKTGAKDNQLQFVVGNPGTTQRLATMAQLEYLRDTQYPLSLERLKEIIEALNAYAKRGDEERRQADDEIFSAANSLKAQTGFLGGLQDPELMNRKREEEGKFRDAVQTKPDLNEQYGKLWQDIAALYAESKRALVTQRLYNGLISSRLMKIGWDLAMLAEQNKMPNERRFREYQDSNRPALENYLYSEAPVYEGIEVTELAENLRFAEEKFGKENPAIKEALAGRTPLAAAAAAVKSSKLFSVAERKRLAADPAALKTSEDGILKLVRILQPEALRYRREYDEKFQPALTRLSADLAAARFAIFGTSVYPDATFTVRVSYGKTMGYKSGGKTVPWATTLGGAYTHETGKEPFVLPPSWKAAKAKLNLRTPFNYAATLDIHGGNSGSPSVDQNGDIVGIVFDSNIEGLPNQFVYTEKAARSLHVAVQGVVEALRKIYNAERVLTELGF